MGFDSKKIKRLFDVCSKVAPSEVEATLAKLCNGDRQLKSEVEHLLKADRENHRQKGFLVYPNEVNRPASISIGSRLGNYQIQNLIGAGSYGEVFLAKDDSEQRFAIKFLLPWKSDFQSRSRFEREARSLSTVEHPNVAKLVETGEFKGRQYLITEYVDGSPLNTLMSSKPLPNIPDRISLLVGICRGVSAIHEHLLLHRDLKPSNILVRTDGSVVVTDLGIAKPLANDFGSSGVTLSGEFVGTPKFMAPEQLSKNTQLVLATDVYGIGGVMYFLLTGQAPFDGDSLFEIADAVRKHPPPRPSLLNSKIEKDLETICLKCLSKEVERRYQTVNELESDLVRWLEHKPIHASDIGLFGKLAYWVRRNPVVATLSLSLIASTVLAIIAISVFWLQAESNFKISKKNATAAEQKRQQLLATLAQLTDVERDAQEANKDMQFRREVLKTLVDGYENLTPTNSKLEKEKAVTWLKLGRVEWGLGNKTESHEAIDEALRRFHNLSQNDPSNIEYQFDIFHCLNSMERYPEALACIETVAKIAPDNEDYQDALSHANLKLGESFRKKGKVRLALQYIARAEEITESLLKYCSKSQLPLFRKKLGMIWHFQARALLQLGQLELATHTLQKSIEIFRITKTELGKYEDVLRHELGAFHLASSMKFVEGEFDDAIKLIQKAEKCSREYVALHRSLYHSFDFRYRVLRDYAFLAAKNGDRELRTKVQLLIETFFENWKNSKTSPSRRVQAEADFFADPRSNLTPNLERAVELTVPGDTARGLLAPLRIALYRRDFAAARSVMNSWTNGFDQPYFQYYREIIDSCEKNETIVIGELSIPSKKMQIEACARGYSTRDSQSFRYIEDELRVLGLE